MSASAYFGWELLYKPIQKDIRSAQDVLVASIHWTLVKNGFLCLGSGEDKVIRENEIGSELLPSDWNCHNTFYSLRYILNNDLYIMHCVILAECTALFNLLNVTKCKVSNLSFEIPETVQFNAGEPKLRLQELIPQIDVQVARITNELMEPVFCKPDNVVEQASQTAPVTQGVETTSFDPHRPAPAHERSFENLREPFRDVGRADLDPFAQGGGMLFTLPNPMGPNSAPGLPRPGVPPGARFDPFMPFNPNPRRFNPDNDHLRAPGFEDEMYS